MSLIELGFSSRECVCVEHVESTSHIFVLCEVAYVIWYRVLKLVETLGPLPHSILGFFELFQCSSLGKQVSLRSIWICHFVVWIILKMRNKIIFGMENMTVKNSVYMIIILIWNWVHAYASDFAISLVDWEHDPLKLLGDNGCAGWQKQPHTKQKKMVHFDFKI